MSQHCNIQCFIRYFFCRFLSPSDVSNSSPPVVFSFFSFVSSQVSLELLKKMEESGIQPSRFEPKTSCASADEKNGAVLRCRHPGRGGVGLRARGLLDRCPAALGGQRWRAGSQCADAQRGDQCLWPGSS